MKNGSPRVLFACDFFLRYSSMLAAGIERTGADVRLVTRDHGFEFGGHPEDAARFVDRAGGGRLGVAVLEGRARSPAGAVATVKLRRAVGRFAPDVIHLQPVGTDPRLMFVAGVPRAKFAFTVHDPVRHPGDADLPRIAHLNREMARHASLVFVHGEALREELIRLVAPRAPIVVVPHGVDPAEVTPVPDRPAILFFGRISRYKGVDVLLDAMSRVWEELPETTLVIAGSGEVDPHPVLDDERITVRPGHVPDDEVPGLIEGARCVALPYRQASQSGVGSLVKPYGRPQVVTAVGSLPELVSDGSGFVVPPEDPMALAEALISVLSDDEVAARLGAAGARTAAEHGSWDAVAAQTLAAYRQYLGLSD